MIRLNLTQSPMYVNVLYTSCMQLKKQIEKQAGKWKKMKFIAKTVSPNSKIGNCFFLLLFQICPPQLYLKTFCFHSFSYQLAFVTLFIGKESKADKTGKQLDEYLAVFHEKHILESNNNQLLFVLVSRTVWQFHTSCVCCALYA